VPDLARLYRTLASLHRAGVPWPQALDSAGRGDWDEASRRVARGEPLSEALAARIGPLDAALLRAGEHNGGTEQVLERLAERHESEARARAERWTALLYPLALAHLGAVLAPLPDLFAGRVAQGLLWSVALLAPVYAWLGLAAWHRHIVARSRRGALARLPAVGPWRSAVEEADARALQVLGDGLDAGLALDETLRFATAAGAGGRVARDLEGAREAVARGERVTARWRGLPEDTLRALRAAEEAGELPTAARREGVRLAFGVEMRRERWRRILPVLLVLAIGAVVAARVIGFYGDALRRMPF
jgi:type II secretory pathway component PulF